MRKRSRQQTETKSHTSLFARNLNLIALLSPLPQTLLLSSGLRARVRLTTGEQAALTSSRERERERERKRGGGRRRRRRRKGGERGDAVYGGSSVYRGMTCPNSTRRTIHGRSRAMTLDRAVVPGDREFVSENIGPFPQAGPDHRSVFDATKT